MSQFQEIKAETAIPVSALSAMEEFEASFPDLASEPAAALPVAPAQAVAAPEANTEVTTTEAEDEVCYSPDGSRWDKLVKRHPKHNFVLGEAYNFDLYLANDPRFCGPDGPAIGYNEMTSSAGILRNVKFGMGKSADKLDLVADKTASSWKESDTNAIVRLMQAPVEVGGFGLSFPLSELKIGIKLAAARHKYHPVRDALRECHAKWDKDGRKERIERLWIDIFGAEDNEYHRQTARIFMISCVARAMEPGCKADYMPVIEGDTGVGKGEFAHQLGMGFGGTLKGKTLQSLESTVEATKSKWIIELPELDAINSVRSESAKAFLTDREDTLRLKHTENADDYRRGFMLIGTTEHDAYLRDPKSNRRFWPIVARIKTAFDFSAFRKLVPLLWGEAFDAYLKMREAIDKEDELFLDITGEAKAEAKRLQNTRRIETDDTSNKTSIEFWLANKHVIFDDKLHGAGTGFELPTHWKWIDLDGKKVGVLALTCLPVLAMQVLKAEQGKGKTWTTDTARAVRDIPWLENTGKPRCFDDYDLPAKAFAVRTDHEGYRAVLRAILNGDL